MKFTRIFILMFIVLTVNVRVFAADYAVILKTLSNPFWVEMKNGIEKEAKKRGISVDIVATLNEGDTEAQLRLFENLLNKKYKGIAFAPISGVNLIQPAVKAYKKGIYLVNLDEAVDLKALKRSGGNVFAFVTTNNVAVGATGASFIIDKFGRGSEVAIIEGKSGAASGEARRQGAANAFKKARLKVVASQPADWDRTKALDVATNIIQRFPNIKAIYAANDTMALGAVQAVSNSRKKIIVVGTDGAPEAIAMVKKGSLDATVAQDPAAIGVRSFNELIKAVKNGKQISVNAKPDFINIPSKLIK